MKAVERYLRALMEDIDADSMSWKIEEIVTVTVSVEDGKEVARINGKDRIYERSSKHFVWQRTRFEDDYYGTILYPLDGDKYLKIDYEC